MVSCTCKECDNWTAQNTDAESSLCKKLKVNTFSGGTCPLCINSSMTLEDIMKRDEEAEQRKQEILSRANKPTEKVELKSKTIHITPVKIKRTGKAFMCKCDFNPSGPTITLYKHQKEAFDRYKDADVIPLFFEMGCGKTATTLKIAEYKYLNHMIEGLLVVAPNGVHYQWWKDLVEYYTNPDNRDAKQWLNCSFIAQCVGGVQGQSALIPIEEPDASRYFHFISVNVDTFSTPHKWEDIVLWANLHNYMIAIDEATVIKNPSSKRSERLLYEFNNVQKRGKTILSSIKKFPTRAVLTGTPATNGPMDLWAIMEFVQPNFFGRNYFSFKMYYGMFTKLTVDAGGVPRTINVLLTEKTWQAIKNCEDYITAASLFGVSEETYMTIMHQNKFLGPYKHADELKQKLNTVATFCKLVDCVDMPATNYMVRQVPMSKEQQEAYDSMKKDLLVNYNDYTMTAANKMVMIMRLSQISSGFINAKKSMDLENVSDLWDENTLDNMDIIPEEVVWLGKSNPKLDQLMDDIAECDKPLLVITRYSAEAAKIYDMLKDKYRTCMITGWKNVGTIDEFKEGKYDIMVANNTKIHRGYNLQIAHTTLFYGNTFNLEIRQQTEFRTFRIGQKHPCTYIDYTCSQADDTIMNSLQIKQGLLNYLRDKNVEDLI